MSSMQFRATINVDVIGDSDEEAANVYDSILTSIEEGDHNTDHGRAINVKIEFKGRSLKHHLEGGHHE